MQFNSETWLREIGAQTRQSVRLKCGTGSETGCVLPQGVGVCLKSFEECFTTKGLLNTNSSSSALQMFQGMHKRRFRGA